MKIHVHLTTQDITVKLRSRVLQTQEADGIFNLHQQKGYGYTSNTTNESQEIKNIMEL